jgi:hypothetical protein
MSDNAGNKQSTKKDTISSRGINKTPTKYIGNTRQVVLGQSSTLPYPPRKPSNKEGE